MKNLNKDYNRREQIIFGTDFDSSKYLGGVRYFQCSKEMIQQLLDEGFINPGETQNDSPSVRDFLEYTENFPEKSDFTFGCYAVSPERDDYRITIESIDFEIPETDYDDIAYAVETFRYADEFLLDHNNYGYYHFHAWWD